MPAAANNPRLVQAGRLLDEGRAPQARALLAQALAKAPGDVEALRLMRHTLTALGQHEQALYYAERALRAAPGDADLMNLVGNSLVSAGRRDEAIDVLRRAVERDPGHAAAAAALANTLASVGRLPEARAVCEAALRAHPAHAQLSGVLSIALVQSGHVAAARTVLHAALEKHPFDLDLASMLAGSHVFLPESPARLLADACSYGRTLEALSPPPTPIVGVDRRPDRGLRVGLIGPDFGAHASAFFLEPLLAQRISGIDLRVYHTSPREDDVSRRLRDFGTPWTSLAGLGPARIVERLRADRVDIAVELTGHYIGNLLPAFQQRVAPVQVEWLGYPCTTGVRAMDWRIVDSGTDPAGAESQNCEQLLRIDPCFVCYAPPAELPPISAPPCTAGSPITFASFASHPKINDDLLRVWARILNAVPNSRMILKNTSLRHETARAALAERCAACGLDPQRLSIEPPSPGAAAMLHEYARVDIVLDSFPCAGMTSTCEAAIMGVPTVALPGLTSASRGGVSVMRCVGLDDLLCTSINDYIAAAVALARDRDRLVDLHANLRPRTLRSALCDQTAFAARFSAAMRRAWQAFCAAG